MRWAVLSAYAMLAIAACDTAEPMLIQDRHIVGDAIPVPLTQIAGDPQRGLAVFLDRDGAHCLLCHAVEGLDAPFQGNLAPSLTGVGRRLTEGQIRLQVADARRVVPDTIMPSYYRIDGLNQVMAGHRGSPVLSAQQVEDLTAYLVTLRAPTMDDKHD